MKSEEPAPFPQPSEIDELALVKEFAAVEHVIPYSHYVDQTPVGAVLSMLGDLPSSIGYSTMIFVGLFLIIVLMMYPKMFIVFLFMLLAIFGMTWIAVAMLARNIAVKADYTGISLPPLFILSMNGELDRHWSELKEIAFTKFDLPSYEPVFIVFRFHRDASATFSIDGFTSADLERLLLVISTYCPTVKTKPALTELSSNIISKGRNTANLSFTQLWETELGMRFGSTAFIPHESGDKLREGELRIIGQVAFGGLSAVYLAERHGKQTVILKEAVLPESADDEVRAKCLALFEREAEMLARVDHPRIASVYDAFVEDQRHYLVLEYIEGRNLRTYIGEFGPQPSRTVAIWAEGIAEVLVYLHGLVPAVIHRDLTPDNLIVGRDGEITVVDFGAANEFIGTATGTVVGKNAYIPLEQFRGKATPQSDIYAFGATVFFLLTGRDPEPFSESSLRDIGIETAVDVDTLIRDCTRMELAGRIPNAESLLRRVQQIRKNLH
ncbi:MAG: serine/threonine protein kinase [Candidatus Obscuribacterales bacterium]|nr:serine/threonine protein kinase [Candidatus Obscuribacterales bacterium]